MTFFVIYKHLHFSCHVQYRTRLFPSRQFFQLSKTQARYSSTYFILFYFEINSTNTWLNGNGPSTIDELIRSWANEVRELWWCRARAILVAFCFISITLLIWHAPESPSNAMNRVAAWNHMDQLARSLLMILSWNNSA